MMDDCHAHLDLYTPDEIEQIVKESKKKGIRYIINAGIDNKSNLFSIELAQKYNNVLSSIGLYPEVISKERDEIIKEQIEFIKENLKKRKEKKIVALGEIGLDKTYGNLEKQEMYFKVLVKIAITENIPVIVHTRKAEKETISCLNEVISKNNLFYRKVVLHCFMGNKHLFKDSAEKGWFFSIPPIIERSSHFKFLVKNVSEKNLLTETDSPFLSNIKGEQNYPWNVYYSVKNIAEIKNINIKETENMIAMNFNYLFLS